MRHARGQVAEGGEAVQAFGALAELREAGDVCERDDEQVLAGDGERQDADVKFATRPDAGLNLEFRNDDALFGGDGCLDELMNRRG